MTSATAPSLDAMRQQAQDDVRALRERLATLGDDGLDLILRQARSHYAWSDRPVPDEVIRDIYHATALGPTSMNCCPARFVFVKTPAAKEKLATALKPKNVDKMMSAPVTVIIAYDTGFWQQLPFLFPHEDRRPMFEGKEKHIETTAFRNGTLQGAYFMIAARAFGLDVGAMSGFNNGVVDAEFFAGTTLKSNFLCNLGYADESALFQRLPRFSFEQACSTV